MISEATLEWLRQGQSLIRDAMIDASNQRHDAVQSILVPIIVEQIDPSRIWIFGSVARGEASENSDVDIFVECGGLCSQQSWSSRQDYPSRILKTARQHGFLWGCDMIVWSEEEVKKGYHCSAPMIVTIENEGCLVYERSGKNIPFTPMV